MSQYLPQCAGGEYMRDWEPRVTQYLTNVLEKTGKDLGLRNERELRTLAQSLDAMLSSNYLLAADTLMARFQALELAAQEKNWSVSQHLELIPSSRVGAVSEEAKADAARSELRAHRLRNALAGRGHRSQDEDRRPGPHTQ